MRKILAADTLTPILAYMRIQGSHTVILESIPRDKENARFSIVAYNPVFEIKFENGLLTNNGQPIQQDPLDYLQTLTQKKVTSDLPFAGGAIGFVAYDLIGLYEDIGQLPLDPIGTTGTSRPSARARSRIFTMPPLNGCKVPSLVIPPSGKMASRSPARSTSAARSNAAS